MSALIRGAVPSERTLAARWLRYEARGNGLVLGFRASETDLLSRGKMKKHLYLSRLRRILYWQNVYPRD